IGASVVVKGTTNGVITDIDGNFSLSGVKDGDIIQISFVGYKTVELVWKGKPFNVTLEEDSELLEEVVITAYGGKQLRSKVTNSISKVKEDVLTTGSHTNPAKALSGAVSGLRVQQTSGNPNDVPTMVLRGGTNLDGSGSPLVIVDGQVRSSLADINPEDIESMEVMKDAGATAIYGARANNGVILVTTKRGKEGFSEIRFKAKIGINQFRNNYNFLNARDYLYWFRKAVQNAAQFVQVDGKYYGSTDMSSLNAAQPYGTGNVYYNPDGSVADGNQNGNAVWSPMKYTSDLAFLLKQGWRTMTDPVYGDEIIFKEFSLEDTNIENNALNQDYNVSLTGGNDKGNYYLNLGYNDTKGNAKGNWYKRFSATLNADYKIRPWLTSKSSVSFTDSKWFDIYDARNGDGITNTMDMQYYFSRALSLPPTFRGTNENGDWLYGVRWDLSDTIADVNLPSYQRDNNSNKLNLNQTFIIDILDGLDLKISGTLYLFDTFRDYFNKDIYTRIGTIDKTHKAYASKDRYRDQTYNAVLNYNKQLTEEHYVSAMLGMEYYDSYRTGFDAYGYGAPTADFGDLGLTQTEGREIDSWHERQRIMSFFGRVNYDFMSKYLISIVMRRDGYSKLLGDNRWGFFPGVSAGWAFNKEKFMEPLQNVLSFGKLRASYGLNGNVSGISAYGLQGAYGVKQYQAAIGNLLTTLPNPGLKWEKSHTFEVGLDLGFLENRYMANLTFYNRRTKDKLASITLPSHSGVTNWTTNNGELQNRGLEIDLNARLVDTKDWKFNVNANLSWNKNKIISLPYNGQPNNRRDVFQVYNSAGELIWVGGQQEGQSYGDIYGFKAEGIYKSYDEIPGNLRDISSPNNNGRQITLLGPDAWNALSDAEKKNTGAGGYLPIQPGDVKWKDVNGDGVIDNYDRVKLGNSLPKVTGGVTLTLGWKDLSLITRMDYALGHTVIDNKTPWIMGGAQGTYNTIDLSKDSWTPENPNAKYPTYVWADQFGKRNYCRSNNSLFVYKGDYLAFREITLNYNMPAKWISKVGLKSCELSVTAQNLGYLTAAKTMHSPEYGADSYGGYSIPRSFVFGLNVSF
ncbi:MAG: SusC/RagA family TonB-linked outer membrane protein, partial [Bacteroides sp.]|nr:SusC/RagA family TonB-linked outer membrane protein [Bacteroides sp.]